MFYYFTSNEELNNFLNSSNVLNHQIGQDFFSPLFAFLNEIRFNNIILFIVSFSLFLFEVVGSFDDQMLIKEKKIRRDTKSNHDPVKIPV